MILRPLISEKSMNLSKLGFYTFEIEKKATKKQIEKIVKEKFKVDIESVRTITTKGKVKTQRNRRGSFSEKDLKKAIVKVGKGQKIPLFESATAPEKEEVQVQRVEEPKKVKEKKSLLKGTKVKIEKGDK